MAVRKKDRKSARIKRRAKRRATRQSDKREYNRLANEARRRLRKAEKKRIDYWAVEWAEKKAGFTSTTIPDFEKATVKDIKNLKKFLKMETSKVENLARIRQQQLSTLERRASIRLGKKVKITNPSLLFAMFDSEQGKAFKNQIGSTEFVDKFLELAENDYSFEAIMQTFQDYNDREIGYSEIEETARVYDRIYREG